MEKCKSMMDFIEFCSFIIYCYITWGRNLVMQYKQQVPGVVISLISLTKIRVIYINNLTL
jgi:hypothetical protein